MTASADMANQPLFSTVPTAPPDAILGLTEAFNQDDRNTKMNLSVGVYKDAAGVTPVLKCVKQAEAILLEKEQTKGYLPIDGLADYRHHVRNLVFGTQTPASRIAVAQTPGGTGALRIAADFIVAQLAPAKIWMPIPTWANHGAIMTAAGLPTESYRYLSTDKTGLNMDGMLEDLRSKTKRGDVVLLHACCHNPSGVDPTADQWSQIAEALSDAGLLPLIDFAYQGFGAGLAEDAQGLSTVLAKCPEAIVCNSFSKNFGLYSERVGAISLVAADEKAAAASLSQLKRIVRCNYSNPPRRGAAIVSTILDDATLTSVWKEELEGMRIRIHALRKQFVEQMKVCAPDRDYSFLLSQNGMFSFSGLTPMQVDELRTKHGIYIVGSGRINVAGMNEDRMEWLCNAVASVL